jgi:hypothetical protein
LDGTATNGEDYHTLSGTVTIPANELFTILRVYPINDRKVEGAESVIITIDQNDAPYNVSSGEGSADTFIGDNDYWEWDTHNPITEMQMWNAQKDHLVADDDNNRLMMLGALIPYGIGNGVRFEHHSFVEPIDNHNFSFLNRRADDLVDLTFSFEENSGHIFAPTIGEGSNVPTDQELSTGLEYQMVIDNSQEFLHTVTFNVTPKTAWNFTATRTVTTQGGFSFVFSADVGVDLATAVAGSYQKLFSSSMVLRLRNIERDE